jgi:type IV pilus assembly protein PilN
MARINLLPWREERRQQLQQQFYATLAAAVLLAAGIVYFLDTRVQGQIEVQRQRIAFIEQEQKKLEKAIDEIKALRRKREQLVERMEVIQNLQGNRAIIVHQFDELVRTVPEGVYFTSVSKKNKKFNIEGVAEANNRVSNLMRNFEKSQWFKDPNLAGVQATDESVESSSSRFTLSVQASAPKKKSNVEG